MDCNKTLYSRVTLLSGAHIVDPYLKINHLGFIVIKDGKIISIETQDWQQKLEYITSNNKEVKIIQCNNNLLIPGIIDIHVHTRDFEEKDSGTILTESNAAAHAGITTIVCQPNTVPAMDNEKMLLALDNIATRDSKVDLMTYCAITIGRNGFRPINFAKMSEKPRVVGFSDDGSCVMNAAIMKIALEYSAYLDLPIAQHAEDCNLSCGSPLNLGNASNTLGCKGVGSIAESSIIARDLAIASQIPKCIYHAQHVSSQESLAMIDFAKNKGINVTAEVTPHHILFSDNQIKDTNGKINPPIKSEKHKNAIKKYIKNGVIDCIATDHAPHHIDKKRNKTFDSAAFGTTGFEALIPAAISLYKEGYISIERLVEMVASNPAKIIKKFDSIGTLKVGNRANLTIIDINKQWTHSKNISKSSNSIFNRQTFVGKAICTIIGGNIAYFDKESIRI